MAPTMSKEKLLEQLKEWDAKLSRWPWKLWGWEVRAAKAGFPDDEALVGNSDLIATFPLQRNPTGIGSNVTNAYGVAALRNLLPEIIAQLEAGDGR